MDDHAKKILNDILICIENIERYVGTPQLFSEYEKNFLVQDAVERNLITIGEAMNNLLDLHPEVAITNARRIVNARNKLTHGYDEIDNVQIWSIIVNHLPLLKGEIEKLLK